MNVWAGNFAHTLEYVVCHREIYASQNCFGMISAGELFGLDWTVGNANIHLEPLHSPLLSFSRFTILNKIPAQL